jgi:hypothetical protein
MLGATGRAACGRLDALLNGPPTQAGGPVRFRWGVGLCRPTGRNAIEVPGSGVISYEAPA